MWLSQPSSKSGSRAAEAEQQPHTVFACALCMTCICTLCTLQPQIPQAQKGVGKPAEKVHCLQVLCHSSLGTLIRGNVDHVPGEPDRVGSPVALHQAWQTMPLHNAGDCVEGILVAVGSLHHALHLHKHVTMTV